MVQQIEILRNGYRKILGVLRYKNMILYNLHVKFHVKILNKNDAGLNFLKQRRFLKFQPAHHFWHLDWTCFGGFIYLKKNPHGRFSAKPIDFEIFCLGQPITPKKVEQTKIPVVGSFWWLLFFDSLGLRIRIVTSVPQLQCGQRETQLG